MIITTQSNSRLDSARGKRFVPQFTIRLLLGCIVLVAFSIAMFQFAWPRRLLNTRVVVNSIDIQMLEPHLESMQSAVPSVSQLRVDRSTNSLVFCVQARNLVSATKLVKEQIDELFGSH
jgi:hypothetical protein